LPRVCEPECPAEAIKPDTEPGMERWIALNARMAEILPVITKRGEPPIDREAWLNIENKLTSVYGSENLARV
jgi:ferredoxin